MYGLKVSTLAILMVLTGGLAHASGGLDTVLPHYEAARLLLVADTIDGLAVPAKALREELDDLRGDLSAEAAGVPPVELDGVGRLLPEAIEAARTLEEAESLEEARTAFYALSKPLVRWRQAAGDGPMVAYCPMKRHSWLQPEDQELGNPYYGQSMAGCGEIVDE